MKDNFEFKLASVSKDLRLCVIENSIFIEELSSRVLCDILGIELEFSKSFGHGSTALSFFQKLQLIQDVKGLEKEDLKKLTCLANIRNKFAHVSAIDSFEKLFVDSSLGEEIKKSFRKWYFDKDEGKETDLTKIEFINRLCFYLLVSNVIDILLNLRDLHFYNLGLHAGRTDGKEEILNFCLKILTESQRQEVFLQIETIRQSI